VAGQSSSFFGLRCLSLQKWLGSFEQSAGDTSGLLREAETRFVLGSRSVHGPAHWKAVLVVDI